MFLDNKMFKLSPLKWQYFFNTVHYTPLFRAQSVHLILHRNDLLFVNLFSKLIKDEVLITVGCPIFPSILIAKYLFTGSLKNRSIDNLETQKKYISMKNFQFFNYLLYAKSK